MSAALLLAALLAAKPAAAPDPAAIPPDDFSEVTLHGNVSVGIGLLRLGGDEQEPIPLEGNVVARATFATRFIVDEASGATFGYRLEVVPLTPLTNALLTVRVDILPLAATDEKDLRRLEVCPGCPKPRLVSSSAIRFPPRQIIREGDSMVVDLLERPKTGEKIVDVVKFSSRTVEADDLDDLRGRVRQASGHVRRGDELSARGSLEEAAAEYARAAALRPDGAVHVALGRCHERLGRTELARLEYERAVRLSGENPEALHARALLRHRTGQPAKAVGDYQRALKRRPEWALARRNLGTAHLDRGQVAEAVQEYRQAHRSDATIFETRDVSALNARETSLQYYVFAKVYATEGDVGAALLALRKAADAGFDLERMRQDPDFRPLREDPRFVGVVGRGSTVGSR